MLWAILKTDKWGSNKTDKNTRKLMTFIGEMTIERLYVLRKKKKEGERKLVYI